MKIAMREDDEGKGRRAGGHNARGEKVARAADGPDVSHSSPRWAPCVCLQSGQSSQVVYSPWEQIVPL